MLISLKDWENWLLRWLICSVLMTEKNFFNNRLDIFQDEKIFLVTQMSEMKKQMVILESKNLELKEN